MGSQLTSEKLAQPPLARTVKVLPESRRGFFAICILFYISILYVEFYPTISKINVLNYQIVLNALVLLLPVIYLVTRPGLFRSLEPGLIKFYPEYLETPQRVGITNYLQIPYSQITAIDTRGGNGATFHLVQTRERLLYYPRSCFESLKDWQDFVPELYRKIADLPDGQERLERLTQQLKISHQIFSHRPRATLVLLLTLASILLLEAALIAFKPQELAGIGANSSLLVHQGEFFRLISSGFLHAGYLHFVLNAAALLALGYVIEGLFGPQRFLLIYFSALVAGSSLSVLSGAALSVGASAGIFGLLGALAVTNYLLGDSLPAGLKMSRRWWTTVILINLALPLLLPKIDLSAHLGGATIGALMSWYFTKQRLHLDSKTVSATFTLLYYLVMISVCYALTYAALLFLEPARRDQANLAVMNSIMLSPKATATDLNEFAWDVAITKRSSKALLELANTAIIKAIGLETDQTAIPNLRDTQATVRYRLNDLEQAIKIEQELLVDTKDPGFQNFVASQLLRFLYAHYKRQDYFKSTSARSSSIFYFAELRDHKLYALLEVPKSTELTPDLLSKSPTNTDFVLLGEFSAAGAVDQPYRRWEYESEVDRYADLD